MKTKPTAAPKLPLASAPLTEPQTQALAVLIDGGTVSDAARAAGVTRQTVSGWRNHDLRFIAAMNAAHIDLGREYEDRLRRLVGASLDVLEARVARGDEKAALAVLNAAHRLPKPGPVSPQAVADMQLADMIGEALALTRDDAADHDLTHLLDRDPDDDVLPWSRG